MFVYLCWHSLQIWKLENTYFFFHLRYVILCLSKRLYDSSTKFFRSYSYLLIFILSWYRYVANIKALALLLGRAARDAPFSCHVLSLWGAGAPALRPMKKLDRQRPTCLVQSYLVILKRYCWSNFPHLACYNSGRWLLNTHTHTRTRHHVTRFINDASMPNSIDCWYWKDR